MFYTYVVYGFPEPACGTAPALFERFARMAGVMIDTATYARRVVDHPDGEDVVFVDEAWTSFINNPVAGDFRFSTNGKDPMIFGGINVGLSMGIPVAELSLKNIIAEQKSHKEIFTEFSRSLNPEYGFMYRTSRVGDAISYAFLNGATIYKGLENPFLFSDDLSCHGGPDTYKRSRLRMVYEVNLINSYHLDAAVGEMSFRDWVGTGKSNGSIKQLISGLFIWEVPADEIQRINNELGKAGLLISYNVKQKLSHRLS